MPEPYEELLSIADSMDESAGRGRHEDVQQPLKRLERAVGEIEKSWSGSWIGYHANVYYKDLRPRPAEAHFSQQWGLYLGRPSFSDTRGDWVELNALDVEMAIYERAGTPGVEHAKEFLDKAAGEFCTQQLNALSILELELTDSNDPFLTRLKDQVDQLTVLTRDKLVQTWKPKGKLTSKDLEALSQRLRVPPHYSILAEVYADQHTLGIVASLANLARRAAEHILRLRQRQQPQQEASGIVGTRVFIGHGRSLVWLQLKDFLENTLRLQVEEFNSVPTAGRANKERLLEMMDEAAFALLVMTGDDEFRVVNGEDGQIDTRLYPRLNVVHEAGLFQGRLGFERAIVLLEEGCEAFSNIEGVTQIRFPRNDIGAKSEEIRRVLEREGLLSGDG